MFSIYEYEDAFDENAELKPKQTKVKFNYQLEELRDVFKKLCLFATEAISGLVSVQHTDRPLQIPSILWSEATI